MAFIFGLVVLFLSPFSAAQECSCPVIQCDPCQRRIVMDSQKIMCTAEKSVVCENVVCENVDNYFQCLQGAAAQHVPPEDPYERMTDPRIPHVATPSPAISFPSMELEDFQHFNHVETTISRDEKPGIGIARDLASKKKSVDGQKPAPLVEAEYPWLVEKKEKTNPIVFAGLYNASIDGKRVKPVKKHSITTASGVLTSQQKQKFSVEYGATKAFMEMSGGSSVRFEKEDGHLVLFPVSGSIRISDISARDMLVLDAGEWRFGKSKGELRWKTKSGDAVVYNKKESALMRRDQLIAKSESVEAGTELIISSEYGIVHADRDVPPKDKEFRLRDGGAGKTRILASSPIAKDGCAEPVGEAQQCAWKCFGAKNGKGCTNSETTQCVRFTCSMGGEWKLPTRVSGKECKANSVVVDSCQ